MTIGEIAIKARSLVNADTTNYPDSKLLVDLNIWYQKAVTMILEAQDDADFDDKNYATYPIFKQVLDAGQRDYQIDPSLKMLQTKRVDITYDGKTYYRALPIDDSMENRGLGPIDNSYMEQTIDNRYSKTSPRYDLKYGSLFIYPRASSADVASGATAVAEFNREIIPLSLTNSDLGYVGAATLAAGTYVPGFDTPFHPILAYGCASEFASTFDMPNLDDLKDRLDEYETRLRRAYGNKDKDIKYTFTPFDLPEDISFR